MISPNDNSPQKIDFSKFDIKQAVPEYLRPCLVLRVKRKYYEAIASGEKQVEYREIKDYWRKRIEDRHFAAVVIANLQDTRFTDPEWLIFPWRGYTKQFLSPVESGTQSIFGSGTIAVYAIPLIREKISQDKPAVSA